MPVETMQQPPRQPVRAAVGVSPPRLRPKGPDFCRRIAAGAPKQSAVERLEADKAKYVKSQVALSRTQPVGPPEVKRPLLNPNTPLRPTRKPNLQTGTKPEGVQLDLEHLSHLISDLPVGPTPNSASQSEDCKAPGGAVTAHGSLFKAQPMTDKPRPPPRPLLRPDCSSPAKVRQKVPAAAGTESPGSPGAPAAGTVRRVDVMPQFGPVRTASRPPQFIRQPLQPRPLISHVLLRSASSHQRVSQPKAAPGSSPLKPLVAPVKPDHSNPPPADAPAPLPPTLPDFPLPPPSPAITRLSSSSSRKRPSLTRSKSDMSDRYSRAGTELERFFNLCGLDPSDLRELAASSSDIVSLARFHSVSAPGSECGGSNRGVKEEEEEEEDAGKAADRVPYGISVIERNARVIKWLYGLGQAKDDTTKNTNL
ncbi:protein FAM110A [Nothobranchius furzeri]|uniref:Protein FAM110A-like n=3 Tax=Nothobranchius furzeri TaxID=105023 RepID=A0A8C6PN57_NOTFU|nr:protein FAM110A [Nothobranchius furzeri]XP_054601632.1 protein FAM110A [Nothobranchius furzeri]KAF7209294.1 protein FAM110A-like [Nothobranchius furzeri]